MATGSASGQRPELLSRIDVRDTITGVVAIPHEDAVISTSEDKSVKVWVKRDNGQFWPSIVQSFEATCSALEYEAEEEGDGHLVFVGLGNGQVQEFRLSKDLNRFERKRTYHSHSARVTSIKLISKHDWVISTGRDKRFQWCCTRTGRSLGSYEAPAWCLAVDYDDFNRYAFVANYSGVILVLKLDERNFHLVTTLKGHTCSVWALSYDHERRILFSGGLDQVIVVWDIGSQQGTAYELTGHTGKIRALTYSPLSRKLFSTAEDGKLGVWDMDVEREETPEWGGSNTCEKCGIPFFWNVRGMWENKSIGVRQHHCRKCGRAICGSCSNQQSTYPKMGFEKPVRMCQDCHSDLTTDDRSPMATFYDLKNPITSIYTVQNEGLMVTASEDKFIKLWNISALINS